MSAPAPKPFSLAIPDAAIADLRERLARTRWPDEPPLRALVDGHQRRLPARSSSTTGAPASTGAQWEAKLNAFPQFTVPIRGIDLHFIHAPGRGPEPDAAAALARLAGLGVRVPQADPAARPSTSRSSRRRCPATRCPSSRGSRASASRRSPTCFAELMTDVLGYQRFAAQGGDWGAFVSSVLGHRYRRAPDRHPPQPAGRAARSGKMLAEPDAGGEGLPRRAHPLPQGGDRLPVDPGHPAADAGLRPHRFAGRARRLDRREIPRLDRLRRQSRERGQPRRDAGQHLALLVHRRDRLVVLALLRAHARALADPRGRDRRRADGLRRVPQGDPAPAALAGRAGPTPTSAAGA